MGESLQGTRVRLRPITTADLQPLADLLRDPGVARWWGAYDIDRVAADFVEDQSARVFAIEADHRLVGLIDFYEETEPDYRHATLDIAIADDSQRKGFGADAMRTLIAHLVRCRGHHRITVDPAAANVNAIRFYKRLGFRSVGLMRCYERAPDGRWHDGLLMEYVECSQNT